MKNNLIDEITIHDENNIKGFFYQYRFLSNFELGDVYFEGELYVSSENAYQAAKTLDLDLRKEFKTISPNEAKSLGRNINLREDWEKEKLNIMFLICFDKFYRNKDFREKLLFTGNRYLEETNYWNDVFWGTCNGVGENNLGKILMQIRSCFALLSNQNG